MNILYTDESLKARRGSFTRQVSEDRTRKVAIICKDIPTKLNNNIALRNHFCRYGKVTKVFPNPSKMQATIHFDRHVSLFEPFHEKTCIC